MPHNKFIFQDSPLFLRKCKLSFKTQNKFYEESIQNTKQYINPIFCLVVPQCTVNECITNQQIELHELIHTDEVKIFITCTKSSKKEKKLFEKQLSTGKKIYKLITFLVGWNLGHLQLKMCIFFFFRMDNDLVLNQQKWIKVTMENFY